jgi:putative ATPase
MTDAHPADLFEAQAARDPAMTPLAERMRPRDLDEVEGQEHLLAPGRILRRLAAADRIPSMILWGPPGTGKTTLARLLAENGHAAFEVLSATSAGVKDVRAVVERARTRRSHERRRTMLFVDEIHRFNKAQQDALLPHVESGVCWLVGATTENPSFEVNAALLSRARVLRLRPLSTAAIVKVLRRALEDRDRGLGARGLAADDALLGALARSVAGDARRALGAIELAADLLPEGRTDLDAAILSEALGGAHLRYDKDGEEHYGIVSAFIKSMRASDADASVYWLARMLEAGEDPMFVARRIVIFASEDVGNAEPSALPLAMAAAQAVHMVGMPEATLHLSQAAQFCALAPKSNSALTGYSSARAKVRELGPLPVPPVILNAVTQLMKAEGYGAGYRYPHDAAEGVDPQHESYLPEAIVRGRAAADPGEAFVRPSSRGWEAEAFAALQKRRRGERTDD